MQSSCRIAGEQRVEVGEPVKSGSGAILALTQTPNTAVFPPSLPYVGRSDARLRLRRV